MSEPLLSELVAELSHADLLLNNLFQLDNGKWRASVRSKTGMNFHFYDHPNPGAAILGAIANKGEGVRALQNKPRALPSKAQTGDDLLAELGL